MTKKMVKCRTIGDINKCFWTRTVTNKPNVVFSCVTILKSKRSLCQSFLFGEVSLHWNTNF